MKICNNCNIVYPDSGDKCIQCGSALFIMDDREAGLIDNDNTVKYKTEPHIPNYILLSVIVSVFCFLLTGLIALLCAIKSNSYKRVKKFDEAMTYAKFAGYWIKVSFIIFAALTIIIITISLL